MEKGGRTVHSRASLDPIVRGCIRAKAKKKLPARRVLVEETPAKPEPAAQAPPPVKPPPLPVAQPPPAVRASPPPLRQRASTPPRGVTVARQILIRVPGSPPTNRAPGPPPIPRPPPAVDNNLEPAHGTIEAGKRKDRRVERGRIIVDPSLSGNPPPEVAQGAASAPGAAGGRRESTTEELNTGELEPVELPEGEPASATAKLLEASESGNFALAMEALREPIDVNKLRDAESRTPLMRAAKNGRVRIMNLLLERGADVFARDDVGWTAYMFACASGQEVAAYTLIRRGADPFAVNSRGESGALLAERRGHTELAGELRAMMAREQKG